MSNFYEINVNVKSQQAEARLNALKSSFKDLGRLAAASLNKEIGKSFGKVDAFKGVEKDLSAAVKHAIQLANQLDKAARASAAIKPLSGSKVPGLPGVPNAPQMPDYTPASNSLVNLASATYLANTAFNILKSTASTLFDSLNRAREVEDVKNAFTTLGGQLGQLPTEKLNALREATQGLSNDTDLFKVANQAMLLGVDDGSGKFENLAASAVKLGNAMGISTTAAVESLTIGIGRQSKLVLDNLGILVNVDAAYAKFAGTLGIATTKLSESQKTAAFQAEAFRKIEETAKNLAPVAETAATGFERLTATFTNVTDQFVLGISSSDDLKDALGLLNKEAKDNGNTAEQLGRSFGDLIAAMRPLLDLGAGIAQMFGGLGVIMTQTAQKFSNLKTAFGGGFFGGVEAAANMVNPMGGVVSGLIQTQKEIETATAKAAQLKLKFNEVASSLNDKMPKEAIGALKANLIEYSKQINDTLSVNPEMAKQFPNLTKELGGTIAKATELFEKAKSGKPALSGMGTGAEDAAAGAKKAAKEFESFQAAIRGLSATKMGNVLNPMLKQGRELGILLATNKKTVDEFNTALENLGKGAGKEFQSTLIQGAKDGISAIESLTGKVDALVVKTDDFADLKPAISQVWEEYQKGGKSVDDVKNKLIELAKAGNFSEVSISRVGEAFNQITKEQDQPGSFWGNVLNGKYSEAFKELSSQGILSGDADVSAEAYKNIISDLYKGFEDLNKKFNTEISLEGGDLSKLAADINAQATSLEKAQETAELIGATILNAYFPGLGSALDSFMDSTGLDQKLFEWDLKYAKKIGMLTGNVFMAAFGGGADIMKGLFGENPDTSIRKGFQRFIDKIFKASGLQGDILFPTLGGGLSDKFQIPGGGLAFRERADGQLPTIMQEELDKLSIPPHLISQFDGLGLALGGMLAGFDSPMISQFQDLMAFNFRDASGLNDLQVVLKQAGANAEQLEQALTKAFMAGDVRAREFLNGMSSVQNLFADGIPGATGAFDLAFQHLVDNGLQSGAQLIDALQDIGHEGIEANIPSLQALQQGLINSGKDAQQVSLLFSQLAANGITTLQQLQAIEAVQGAQIGVGLEDAGFAFQEVSADIMEANKNLQEFTANANKKVVTEWEIKTKVSGDQVPAQLAAQTGVSFSGEQGV